MPTKDLRGAELLANPIRNRGTAFTDAERTALGLHGLLPPHVETLAEQARRAWDAFQRKSDALERHIYLRALQDTNEVLFYRVLLDHIAETLPVVYTPVVAEACRQFSQIYRRPRGLFLSYPRREELAALLRNRAQREIDVIVVTDGERILGIGDQGVGGLAISIGKLALYSLIGGIHPARTLPIVLDLGTNNRERLQDPEYLGWRHERLQGEAYDRFLESFVAAVACEMPRVCLQWEDFAGAHARPLLDRYRERLLSFNDDIQGTAAVALGAALAAVRAAGGRFRDQQWVFFGAGTAALGVADVFRAAMAAEGLPEAEARAAFWLVDSRGLVHAGRNDLSPEKRAYAQPLERVAGWKVASHFLPGSLPLVARRARFDPRQETPAGAQDVSKLPPKDALGRIGLAEVIENVRATGLIGLSTTPGAFTEAIVRSMAAKVERPLIFPLSNPTECSEARPEDLRIWTEHRALIATGSPFPATAQCNNVYIFPAVGLGAVAGRARRISDRMMMTAGRALAQLAPVRLKPGAPLLPGLEELRGVALEIAIAVAAEAQREGLAPRCDEDELRAEITSAQWAPVYAGVR
ncbi:MAG: NAD-dependent malic enzyme [Terriglobales bacterium]